MTSLHMWNDQFTTTAPTGFSLPEGSRLGPNCGVTACAIVTGLSFNTVWNFLAAGRRGNWKGRTSVMDWVRVLQHCGIKHDLRMARRMTLHRWVNVYAKPGVTYMVRTSGHVQVVKDRWVIDQMGAKPLHQFWGRRKRMTHIIEIME